MTRSGSVAYYLAAWVCGCTFMGISFWIATVFWRDPMGNVEGTSIEGAFIIVFFSLIFGAATSLLFGFALRHAAKIMHWSKMWHWLAGGAVLAPAIIALLGATESTHTLQAISHRTWLFFPLLGPFMLYNARAYVLLLTLPAGAATAWALFLIQRAFTSPTHESAATNY